MLQCAVQLCHVYFHADLYTLSGLYFARMSYHQGLFLYSFYIAMLE